MPTVSVPYLGINLVVARGLRINTHAPSLIRTTAINRRSLLFTGYAPSRAAGLYFRTQVPNLVFTDIEPARKELLLSTKTPTIIDTSPQPVVSQVPEILKALTGFRPVVAVGQETELSSLIIEGWPPISGVTSPVFFPPRKSLTFTGYEIIRSRIADTDVGSVLLQGAAPSVLVSGSIALSAAVGTLTTTTYTPTIFSLDKFSEPAAASLNLTGAAFSVHWTITPPRVRRQLNAKTPVRIQSITTEVTPAAATLALSGIAPVANRGLRNAPGVTSLSLSGTISSISKTTDTIFVSSKAVVFAPYAATIINNFFMTPGNKVAIILGQLPVQVTTVDSFTGANTRLVNLTTQRDVVQLYR